MEKTEEQNK